MIKKTVGIILIMIMTLIPIGSMAVDIDMNMACSLSISSGEHAAVVEGMEFNLYRVADVDANGIYTKTEEFETLDFEFMSDNEDEWQENTEMIAAYVKMCDMESTDSSEADAAGICNFPSELDSLTPGIYLVVPGKAEIDGSVFTAEPYIVSLPSYTDGQLIYDVTSYPKTGEYTEVTGDEKLPQTGLLWWPCIALAIAGLSFIVIGVAVGRRKSYER